MATTAADNSAAHLERPQGKSKTLIDLCGGGFNVNKNDTKLKVRVRVSHKNITHHKCLQTLLQSILY